MGSWELFASQSMTLMRNCVSSLAPSTLFVTGLGFCC